MKINFKFMLMFASAAALVATACTKEPVQPEEPDGPQEPEVVVETISAELLELPNLAWAEGDVLNIISESGAGEFAMVDFTGNEATFSGNQVKGESFTILKSKAGSTLAAVQERDFAIQSQSADGNTDHLVYDLALVGAKTYKEIAFDESWAKVNEAELKVNSVLKFNLSFPAQVYTLDGLGVKADKNVFFAKNSDESDTDSLHLNIPGVDISVKESKFTAYMLTSWHPLNISETDKITLWAHSNGQRYFAELPQQNLQLAVGQVAEITVEADAWTHYDMSEGSTYNPIKIMTKEDLLAMSTHLEEGVTRYFELGADIDLEGVNWEPLNTDPSKMKGIIFDGKGHKISNLKIDTESEYASFFGVLVGTVKDVTFENPILTSKRSTATLVGVVAGQAGIVDLYDVTLENVDVTDGAATVTNGVATATGLLVGRIDRGEVSDCDVTGKVTHAGANAELNVGGFIGAAFNTKLTNCTSEVDVKVAATSRVISAFVGSARGTGIVAEGCSAKGSLVAENGSTYSAFMFGYIAAKSIITRCSAEGTFSGLSGNAGGFVSDIRGADTVFEECEILISLSEITGNQNGGFVGHIEASTEIKNCCADVNISTSSAASGNQNIGGLVGATSAKATISGCSVTGTITINGQHDNVGGIAGKLHGANSSGTIIEKCSFDGTIGKAGNNRSSFGGVVGLVEKNATDIVIRNCYSVGEIIGANIGAAGIVGDLSKKCTVEYCYSLMDINAGHGIGGIVGRATATDATKQSSTANYENVVRKCIAWSDVIESHKPTQIAPATHFSAGAVVAYTLKYNTMEDCYRKADLDINVFDESQYADANAVYDQENSNAETALSWNATYTHHCPYHGKAAAADATVSSVAKTLGWDTTIWDLSTDYPAFK